MPQNTPGFTLSRTDTVDEISSTALFYEHDKTGAEIVILQSADDNKVFMATFATPPDDDNGVAHIVEHSVLNGSRKYPVKEPFAELLKGSLYTFLNAMTYPERTVYPVASRNAQDFRNLMDVYLDAMFFPNMTEHTFMQEGWHLNLEDRDDPLRYSGVVFNEMCGVFSDPESVLHDHIDQALFPNTVYGKNSGGDPEAIPSLTYEGFCEFHRKYYHPSNCRIVICGDVDVAEQLAHLAEYLDHFERAKPAPPVQMQAPFEAPRAATHTFPVAPGESTENRTYLVRASVLDVATEPEFYLGMAILTQILIGTPAAPLRKALLESRLGQDTINYGLESDILQTYFSVGLKGSEPEALPEMVRIIDETLGGLVRDGIDPRTVEAALNSVEFNLREANFGGYPKGLIHGLSMVTPWLHGADPLVHLRYELTLAAIRRQVQEGRFFESMIETYLIDNPHTVTITLTPDEQMAERQEAARAEQLAAIRAGLNHDDIDDLLRVNAELVEAQETPDSPEALASIPVLDPSCISRQAEVFPFELVQEGPRLSHSLQDTSGIAYITVCLDAAGIPGELLSYMPVFAKMSMQSGTASRDFVDMTQEIGIHTGGIHCSFKASTVFGKPDTVKPQFIVTAKALTAKVPKAIELITEILTDAALDNSGRLTEVVNTAKAQLQRAIVPSGHRFAALQLAAIHSLGGRYNEVTSGLSQYRFREQLVQDVDSDPGRVSASLNEIRSALLHRGGLHVHVTGGTDELAAVQENLSTLADALPAGTAAPQPHDLATMRPNIGYIIPSQVQYVGMGVNFFDLGYQEHGNFEVLSTLLSRDYLWNRVRVQGQAYGCFCSMDALTGNFACISYRDPHLDQTLVAYCEIADYLENMDREGSEFEKLIISTMGTIDSPQTPDQKGNTALVRFRSEIPQADVQRRREQVLDCTAQQLRDYAPLFRQFTENAKVCVVGSHSKLTETENLASTERVFG
jgi:Zn-dependent M16 (insulinase) family peptidase